MTTVTLEQRTAITLQATADSLRRRGLSFTLSGPYVWNALNFLPAPPDWTARDEIFVFSPLHQFGGAILSLKTPADRVLLRFFDAPALPPVDALGLPPIEWLISDWIAAKRHVRRHSVSAFRRRLLAAAHGRQPFDIDFAAFRQIAQNHARGRRLVEQLERRLGPPVLTEVAFAVAVELTPPAPLASARILPIPCDRHGRALRRLSRAEVLELTARSRAGDERARNTLLLSNRGLIHMQANRYLTSQHHEDMTQNATFGLIRAIQKFDPTANTQFSTYASWWVLDSISKDRMRHTLAESAPRNLADGARAADRVQHKSLHSELVADEPMQLIDLIEDDDLNPADNEAILGVERDTVRLIVAKVLDEFNDPRFNMLVERRILAEDAETLAQVGARMGASQERVRGLEKKFLARVHELLLQTL